MRDSNSRPSAYKAGALPTELIRHGYDYIEGALDYSYLPVGSIIFWQLFADN